jgi:MYXO-CTERM domain-containing protein
VRGAPDVDGMATLNGDTVQVLLWNYHDDIVTVAATPVHLAIALPAAFGSRARVSHLRVDESHGDAYTVWVAQGMPASPSAAQIAALAAAMDPSLLVPDRAVAVAADGSVGVDFELPRFGVSLVTITPAGVADDGGTDVDGGGDAGPVPARPDGGCGCRAGGRRDRPADTETTIALATLLIVFARRRRRTRPERRDQDSAQHRDMM